MLTAFAAPVTASEVADNTTSQLGDLVTMIALKVPLWIAAFVVIIIFFILAKIVRNMVENKLTESGMDEAHQEVQVLGGRIAYAIVLTLGITIGLKIAGIDITTIVAAGAFGIGFALQDLIMNFLAGIMILVSRHFTIGDFINIGGTLGRVTEIQSRVTILQAIDGTKVIVPNAQIFREKVISLTSNPFRRIEVIVSVDYRANLENALKVCLHAAKKTNGVLLEPKPYVLIDQWGDSNIDIKVRAWVESRSGWLKIKSRLYQNLKDSFDEYHIDMAWPIVQILNDKDQEHSADKIYQPKKKLPTVNTETENKVIVPADKVIEDKLANFETQGMTGLHPAQENINKPPEPKVSAPIDLDTGEQPLKPLNEV